MTQVEFNYEGTPISIQSTLEENIEDIIKKFLVKIDKKKENLVFIYGGGILKENLTFNEQANLNDKKRKKMNILVNVNLPEENEE